MGLGNCIEVEITLSGISGSVVTPLTTSNTAEIQLSGTTTDVTSPTGDICATITLAGGENAAIVAPHTVSSDLDCSTLSGAGTITITKPDTKCIISGAVSAIALPIKDEGGQLTSAVSSIDFVGLGVTATNIGSDVTVTVPKIEPINCDVGSGIYSGEYNSKFKFRSIIGTGNVVITGIEGNDCTIYISGSGGGGGDGEGTVIGASNIGVGSGIYSGTIDNDLKFRSLSGISGIKITGSEKHTIVISGQTGDFVDSRETGVFVDRRETGVFVTGAENIGTGSGIYSGKHDATLSLRSISGVSGVKITGAGDHTVIVSGQTGDFVDKRETGIFITGASNIGTGSGIYSGSIDNDLKFRSLSGISGIKITGSEKHTIVISGQTGDFVDSRETGVFVDRRETGVFVDRRETGVFVTGAENIGTGSGIYSGKHDATLSLRSISGVSGVKITGAGDHTVIVSGQTGDFVDKRETGIFITGASNIGTGSGIYSGTINNDLKLRTLVGSGNVVISGDERHIYITGEKPKPISASDEGTLVEDRVTSFNFIGDGIQASSPSEGVVTINTPGITVIRAGAEGTGAGFHAYIDNNVSITNSTYTALPCDEKSYDIRNDYNVSTYKFIPTISGIYLIGASARVASLGQGKYLELILSGTHKEHFKLLTEGRIARSHHHGPNVTNNLQVDASVIIDTHATGEYYQAFVFHDEGGSKTLIGERDATFFNAQIFADPSPISGIYNIGDGTGIASGIREGIIQFRSILGISGVTITGEANSQIIYISGETGNFVDKRETGVFVDRRETGVFVTGAENIGTGSGIYSGKHDATLSLRSISGVSGVKITGAGDHTVIVSGQTGDFVDKRETGVFVDRRETGVFVDRRETGIFITGADNICVGESTHDGPHHGSGVFSGVKDNAMQFRSLVGTGGAGENDGRVFVTGIEGNDECIFISGSGFGGGGGGDVTWVDPPHYKNAPGKRGQIAFDWNYFYICVTGHGTTPDQEAGLTGEWRRTAISEW